MKLLYLSIIYSLLLINTPTYSMTEHEYEDYIYQLGKRGIYRDWSIFDAVSFIYTKSSNKTPSELADYFKITNAPIKQIERENPNNRHDQNYYTALYIFIKSNYKFEDFLKTLQKACST